MIREIISYPDQRLRQESIDIQDINDPKVISLINNLIDTMESMSLIGLSAIQIGYDYRIFVTHIRQTEYRKLDGCDELRVYINPKIIKASLNKNIIYEACGSYLNQSMFGPVKRSKEITLEAFNRKGGRFCIQTDGLLARVIQHEIDHLNGKLFVDHININKLIDPITYKNKILSSETNIKNSKINIKRIQEIL